MLQDSLLVWPLSQRCEIHCDFPRTMRYLLQFLQLFSRLVLSAWRNFTGWVCERIHSSTWNTKKRNGKCVLLWALIELVEAQEWSECFVLVLWRNETRPGKCCQSCCFVHGYQWQRKDPKGRANEFVRLHESEFWKVCWKSSSFLS